jgi:hypothetical protein
MTTTPINPTKDILTVTEINSVVGPAGRNPETPEPAHKIICRTDLCITIRWRTSKINNGGWSAC